MHKRLCLLGLLALGAVAFGCQEHKDRESSTPSSTGTHQDSGGSDMSAGGGSSSGDQSSAPATQPAGGSGSTDAGASNSTGAAAAPESKSDAGTSSTDAKPEDKPADAKPADEKKADDAKAEVDPGNAIDSSTESPATSDNSNPPADAANTDTTSSGSEEQK